MFTLPNIPAWSQSSVAQSTFLGLNKTFNVGDGEFSDMLNLSSDHYPAMAPRRTRHSVDLPEMVQGAQILDVITKGEDVYYVYVSSDTIYFCGGSMDGAIVLADFYPEGLEFIHAVMNNRIFVSPKGDAQGVPQFVFDVKENKVRMVEFDVYAEGNLTKPLRDSLYQINVPNMDQYLEAGDSVRVTFPGGFAAIGYAGDRICTVESINEAFFVVFSSDPAMANCNLAKDVRLQRESIRLDYVTSYNNRLFGVAKYEEKQQELEVPITDASVSTSNEIIAVKYDPILILDVQKYNGKQYYIRGNEQCVLYFFEANEHGQTSIRFGGASDEFKKLVGWVDNNGNVQRPTNFSALVGETLVSIEKDDRVDTIFASALGSPASWTNYDGTSMASYYASVASDGEWTGIKAFDGAIWCFKEDSVFQFYGTEPANFGYTEIKYTGIKKGSSASSHIIGSTMFYHSKDGMAALSSGSFGIFSKKLGEKGLSNVKCSSVGSKLYVAANQDENTILYVFDTEKGVWHKEDSVEVEHFVKIGDDLRFICDGKFYSVNKCIGESEKIVSWMAETGNIGLYTTDYKRIVKMNLRAQIPLNGEIIIEVSHDDGEFETVKRINGRGIGMQTFYVYPKRCDHFKLRFRGKGDCRIISLVKTVEGGSDVSK